MNYLFIKNREGYEEYPIKTSIVLFGHTFLEKELVPFQWTKTEDGLAYFYILENTRKFETGQELTIGEEQADIVIPGCACHIWTDGNTLHVKRKENGEKAELFLNGMFLEDGEKIWKEGDELLAGTALIAFYQNAIVICAKEEVQVNLLEVQLEQAPFEGFPSYTRSPRLIKKVPVDEIEIKKPPESSKMKKGSLLQLIVPPLVMLCITVFVSIFMKRGLYVIVSLASTVMTTIFSIIRYFNERQDCREKNRIRDEKYTAYLLNKRKELNAAREAEKEALSYNYPPLHVLEKMVSDYSSRIYERSAEDGDFLTLSVGRMRDKVSFPIRMSYDELKLDKDDLEEKARRISEKFAYIDDKPVIIDLKKAHLGIVGEKENIHEQLKLLVAQMTFFQSYHDLELIVIHNKQYDEDFKWMNWYPHLKIQALNMSGNINSEKMRDQILGSVLQILKDRKLKIEENDKKSRFLPHFVFIIDEPKLIMDHSIMEYLNGSGNELGFSIIYTTHLRANLPENIGTILELDDSKTGTLLLNETEVWDRKLNLDHVDTCNLEWMARNLSVLIHEKGITSNIPENITFFEMYGIQKPQELHAKARWNKNESHKSLAVPLGVRAENDFVYLNLHEKAHGPHGLVAGTTGSGKSEIIQSYILSLAVNFHPYEVGFLLIDYKGGGMAGLFKKLPHLLGTITNLDGSESKRAMASIKSELARRQRIFGMYNVNHINAYNKLWKSGEAEEPIPHLFLISDEFAELKKEQPDFMDELVSTARIGRSLGIHLILATQKPSGVVNDQIWTNSRFKLALKVQNEADSKEIIKTPDAAYITQAGRAYLQVGNNEIYELFQSAWSGAEYLKEGEEKVTDNRVYRINDLGQGELLNEDLSGNEESNQVKATQLDVIVDYLHQLFEEEHLPQVKRPWLPPLPSVMSGNSLQILETEEWQAFRSYSPAYDCDLSFPLGMIDIPEQQMQEEYWIDLKKDGNMVFMSSAGYGKTMTLMTSVLSLAVKNQVENLNFYVLDFGNSALIPLNALPHTADYMLYDDVEKLSKFAKILQEEMSRRKKLFAEKMVQNFTVYNQTEKEKLKAIVIVVDNFDVVKELDVDLEPFFTRLSRDGAGLGIYMMITATRVNGVKYSILNNFKIKIAGFLFDQTEANSLVGRGDYKLQEIRGRALVKTQNINLMQIYTLVVFKNEMEYNQKIKEVIERIANMFAGRRAPRIPILPETFVYPMLKDYTKAEERMDIALGLDVETVEQKGFIRTQSPFVIIGETAKGKTNTLKIILQQLVGTAEAYLFDSQVMSLYSFQNEERVHYVQDEEDMEEFIENVREICENRKEALKEALKQENTILPEEFYRRQEPVYIIIDDMDVFLENGKNFQNEIAGLMKNAAECGVGIIITVHAAKLKGYDELTKWVKTAAYGLVLSQQGILNIFPVRTIREYPADGQGLLFHNGTYDRILLPKCE